MPVRRVGLLLLCVIVATPWRTVSADTSLPRGVRADKILVLKSERKLLLMKGDKVLKTYRVALGEHPVGPKQYSGDRRTPEGIYTIHSRNRWSQYHRSLHISYPNASDRARARKMGKDPGGDVCIHGLPNGQGWIGKNHVAYDWTWGCIAVTDEEIEEIWDAVPNGTPIEIRP